MARQHRFCPAGIPQHVVQRGNNKRSCFVDDKDFINYARWMREYSLEFDIKIHAWVFMSNHVHLLLTPGADNGIAKFMQGVGRRYVLYFNHRHAQTGTLWEGRYKSSLVETSLYLLACYRYIELNPVRANIVEHPSDYEWSSYHSNATGKPSSLLTPHEEYLALGPTVDSRQYEYRSYLQQVAQPASDEQITQALNKGLVTGSASFVQRLEQAHDIRFGNGKRGRPFKCSIKAN